MSTYIALASDEQKLIEIKDMSDINSLDDLMEYCKKKFLMPDMDESKFGFKTKNEHILLRSIGEIVKNKATHDTEDWQKEKDIYDGKLKTDHLLVVELEPEGKVSVGEVKSITKELQKLQRDGKVDVNKLQSKKELLHKMKKVSYNLRADQEMFVDSFVANDGIKNFMQLIEECQLIDEIIVREELDCQIQQDLIAVICQALACIFSFRSGVEAIKKKAKKYFEKFFELSAINQQTKKQVIKVFFNLATHLEDSFDNIVKAAMSYSRETNSIAFQPLI